MKWPRDRKFVDKDGKILDHWRGPLGALEPLLAMSIQDFVALKEMIKAAKEAEEDGGEGAAINLALPIDEEPLPSEDWFITYKNSAKAGRRAPMSAFSNRPALISTTAISGAIADVAIPSGYTDILVITKGMSASANGFISIGFSEDGGTTLVNQAIDIHRNGASQAGLITAATATWTVSAASASSTIYGRMTIYDYRSAALKFIEEIGFNFIPGSSVTGWNGGRLLTNSAAPINMIRFEAAGTFDAGTIELWGIP